MKGEEEEARTPSADALEEGRLKLASPALFALLSASAPLKLKTIFVLRLWSGIRHGRGDPYTKPGDTNFEARAMNEAVLRSMNIPAATVQSINGFRGTPDTGVDDDEDFKLEEEDEHPEDEVVLVPRNFGNALRLRAVVMEATAPSAVHVSSGGERRQPMRESKRKPQSTRTRKQASKPTATTRWALRQSTKRVGKLCPEFRLVPALV